LWKADAMPARILVAEDDPSVRAFVSRALALRGHDVTAVNGGVQALEALGTDAFQLLITDIVMPGLDGIALALRVGRDYPDLPILLMTGYSAERQQAHHLGRLTARVILKPFTLRQICEAVDETLTDAAGTARISPRAGKTSE
jgi:CheY-like chemotaxis protein